MPDCTEQRSLFQGPDRRSIVAEFNGGRVTLVPTPDPDGVMRLESIDYDLMVLKMD